MCVMRNLLAQKTKLITTNGFSFVVIYCACASLMVLVQIFAARGPAHMKSALRSFEGLKNQNTDNKSACFILTYFFLILFLSIFYSSPSIEIFNFFNTTMGPFRFTKDLNCSPQKPFLSLFLFDALPILKAYIPTPVFFTSPQNQTFGFWLCACYKILFGQLNPYH